MKRTFFLACGFAIAAFVCAHLVEGPQPLGGPHPLAIFPRASVVAAIVGYLMGVGAAVAMIRRDAIFGSPMIARKRFIVACVLSAAATWGIQEYWTCIDTVPAWRYHFRKQIPAIPANQINTLVFHAVVSGTFEGVLSGSIIGLGIGGVAALFIPRRKSIVERTSQGFSRANNERQKEISSQRYPNRRLILDIACVIGLIEFVGGVLWTIGAGVFGGSQAYWLCVYFFMLTGPMTLLPASLLAFKQPRWAGRWLIASAFVSGLAAVLVMMPPTGTWSPGELSWGAYVRKWSSALIIPFSIPMLYLGSWLTWTNRRSSKVSTVPDEFRQESSIPSAPSLGLPDLSSPESTDVGPANP